MAPKFDQLVRFMCPGGQVYYGELGLQTATLSKEDSVGQKVRVYGGKFPWDSDFVLTTREEEIPEVICPLENVPIFECIGLNYKKHIAEAGFPQDQYPTAFTKPPDALAGPYEDNPIHPDCKNMDYEAEPCAVIRKDCKNIITEQEALACILGYTAGNDVSSRYWQMPARSNKQHGSAKSFDKFAPIGPTILSPQTLHSRPDGLSIKNFVNGDLRQAARTDDLVFDLGKIICHLSRGTTLRKETVIMTGTPGGVAVFMKPPQWLKNNDIVEIEIEFIRRLRNRMLFEGREVSRSNAKRIS